MGSGWNGMFQNFGSQFLRMNSLEQTILSIQQERLVITVDELEENQLSIWRKGTQNATDRKVCLGNVQII